MRFITMAGNIKSLPTETTKLDSKTVTLQTKINFDDLIMKLYLDLYSCFK